MNELTITERDTLLLALDVLIDKQQDTIDHTELYETLKGMTFDICGCGHHINNEANKIIGVCEECI